jgi:hypothetical protein
VYCVVAERAAVDTLPLVATAPLQPPEAQQALAFADCQLKVELAPSAMVEGVAVSVTVGAAPNPPVQVATPPLPLRPPDHPQPWPLLSIVVCVSDAAPVCAV